MLRLPAPCPWSSLLSMEPKRPRTGSCPRSWTLTTGWRGNLPRGQADPGRRTTPQPSGMDYSSTIRYGLSGRDYSSTIRYGLLLNHKVWTTPQPSGMDYSSTISYGLLLNHQVWSTPQPTGIYNSSTIRYGLLLNHQVWTTPQPSGMDYSLTIWYGLLLSHQVWTTPQPSSMDYSSTISKKLSNSTISSLSCFKNIYLYI